MFNDSQLLHKVVNGDLPGVQELVNAGVSVNGNLRPLRDIPLILATVEGHIRIAKFLIARGANLESACLEDVGNENGEMSARKGTRALHLSSSPEMTSVLLKAGACLNATDADGCTSLVRTGGGDGTRAAQGKCRPQVDH
ncbi:similar to ankyrin 2,3/unc44 [Ectocarpus siliculosus]|uniref:Similar to ankyrin 2,3/unc44 n=1 Tax=Ectocarpus siliculosus TaxID=2880 RepID=D8LEI1_ECTSI|nr:similar to ankyrin 2,3/unc44 [Ectocarpus siliculosus]|eukprot:CBN80224.1 similar to ankyrin 2,3/unc44 [Ectocarpus siliculosus]